MHANGKRKSAGRKARAARTTSPKPTRPAASPADVKESAAPLPRHDLDFEAPVPPAADEAVDTWGEADEGGRASMAGVVHLRGLPTLGYDGWATEIVGPFCCPTCLEMRTRLHPDCAKPSPVMRRAYDRGWLEPARGDGEWRAVLTAVGVEALAPGRGSAREAAWSGVP